MSVVSVQLKMNKIGKMSPNSVNFKSRPKAFEKAEGRGQKAAMIPRLKTWDSNKDEKSFSRPSGSPVAYGGRPSCSAGSLRVSQQILFFVTNESVGFDPLWARQGRRHSFSYKPSHLPSALCLLPSALPEGL